MTTATDKLETALAVALAKLEGAKKKSANPHFKSKYADLGSVIDAIRPIAEHGIWFRQSTHPDDNGVTVETFYIGHGASISAGVLHMPADKRNPQGFGSALTYCRRYALQTAFGLAAEDDDGNAASNGEIARKEPANISEGISEGEWAELVQLIEATGTDAAKFCGAYKIGSVKQLPASAFDKARAQLLRKLEKVDA
jgi:hypothetical protein